MSLRPAAFDPRQPRLCVGVLSGTSVDAAEAALCRVEGTGGDVKLTLLAHESRPFEPELVARVLGLHDAQSLCALDFELGERFAEAVLAVIARAGLSPREVHVVGSHGQTMAHLPPGMGPIASTLQIGEAAVIAERTGLPVVSDFRPRDMAVGGQGAPLIPYLDWAVFRGRGKVRAFQNIGGIANVSIVSERVEDTLAFDTGPGNMLLDALARRVTGGLCACDVDGTLSARGQVIPALLDELLGHRFLAKPPPRSAGREDFGEALLSRVWERHGTRPYDVMATARVFTVEATARAYETYVLPRFPMLDAVYVSGGGSRNPGLMEGLKARLAPVPVERLDVLGFPEAAKEAALFALLAAEHLVGTPANVQSATGARRQVVLGKLTP
ncbi:anhydro-N-acetylmuramic acid kinase [Corallococcus sp. H22C18031201]|uniref:anhydro-N-acetylmuramic acid kinase n=1 Tax=Citreicoccus inhibens TaxID=2849499 RepID=UPI000E707DE2|nr:anhydro-N-acetylmuramic acid kinase [Citreicoccus inhibens]MBU8898203.1 anhydro-N-acetylmuramic acid kinase [Citreicoccus inhibens]RJS26939.1 anhydro-N-acetylmuramic acid kinase [Corallococcus sp. H22C18031201]